VTEVVVHGIKGEEAEDENIDGGDEHVAQHRVGVIDRPVDITAQGEPPMAPIRKVTARETEMLPICGGGPIP
jgi:hypothetical protein